MSSWASRHKRVAIALIIVPEVTNGLGSFMLVALVERRFIRAWLVIAVLVTLGAPWWMK